MATEQKPNPNALITFSAADIMEADPQPPEFVIEDLIVVGLTFWGGDPKIGKSYLMLQMAESVAEGQSFWGRKVKRCKAYYLALEDSKSRLNRRMKQLNLHPSRDLLVTCNEDARNIRTIKGGLLDQLSGVLTLHPDIGLVIIDTAQRVKGYGRRGLTAYESDSDIYSGLQGFALQKGIAIICVTHLTKGNRFIQDPFERLTGSMGGSAVADTMVVLTGKRGEPMTLSITGRDIDKPGDYEVAFKDGRWVMLGETEELARNKAVSDYRSDPIVKVIVNHLKNEPSWAATSEQIMSEIEEETDGKVKIANAKALGICLDRLSEMLLNEDSITFRKVEGRSGGIMGTDGKYHRGYRFQNNAFRPFL